MNNSLIPQRPQRHDPIQAILAGNVPTAEQRASARAEDTRRWWQKAPGPLKLVTYPGAALWYGARYGIEQWRVCMPGYVTAGLIACGCAAQDYPVAAVAAMAAGTVEIGLRLRPLREPPEDAHPFKRLAYRAGRRTRATVRGRVYAVTVWAASGAWLAGAATVGPSSAAMPWAFGIGAIVLGVPWVTVHARTERPVKNDTEDQDAEQPGVELVKAGGASVTERPEGMGDQHWIWESKVSQRILPGSQLHDLHIGDGFWRGVVALEAGVHTLDHLRASVPLIASAYDVPGSAITVDPTESGSERLGRIAVYHTNPLQQISYWEGPHLLNPATGCAPIGPYPDGQLGQYMFWKPGSGPVHDSIAGTTDSGKSAFLSLLLAYERHSPYFVSWVGDPQEGQSLPEWQDEVDWYGRNPREVVWQLRDAKRFMLSRNRRLAVLEWRDAKGRLRKGVSNFDPARLGMPILSMTVDEAGKVLKNGTEAGVLAEEFASMARKAGGRLRLADQSPMIDSYGGSGLLKEMLNSGNNIVFRTGRAVTGQLAFEGMLSVKPHLLPKLWPDGSTTAGLAYADLPTGRRTAMLRTFFDPDPYHWATTGQLQELQATDTTELSERYHTRRERGIAEDKGRVQIPVQGRAPLPQAPAAPETQDVTGSGDFDIEALWEQARKDAAALQPGAQTRGTARAEILSLMLSDPMRVWTNAEVIDRTGIQAKTVSSALTRLVEHGSVDKRGTGRWQVTAKARKDAADVVAKASGAVA
ncbi:winged helix-turn-helix domain-containing protein [Kitasatospora sp. NPDC056076]|uniref:winged helix-turn-helix domain-containing protein n=1 Tax=Kitasatospora sp. NPDC056076 TaxID=3345703 RepID=UPI0035D88FF1